VPDVRTSTGKELAVTVFPLFAEHHQHARELGRLQFAGVAHRTPFADHVQGGIEAVVEALSG